MLGIKVSDQSNVMPAMLQYSLHSNSHTSAATFEVLSMFTESEVSAPGVFSCSSGLCNDAPPCSID